MWVTANHVCLAIHGLAGASHGVKLIAPFSLAKKSESKLSEAFIMSSLLSQWLNSKQVMIHSGGHLPFEADVTTLLAFDKPNRITAAINNTLSPTTLPPGEIKYLKGGDW